MSSEALEFVTLHEGQNVSPEASLAQLEAVVIFCTALFPKPLRPVGIVEKIVVQVYLQVFVRRKIKLRAGFELGDQPRKSLKAVRVQIEQVREQSLLVNANGAKVVDAP